MSQPEPELTMTSAARVLGVYRETVRAWIERGDVFRRWRESPTGRVFIPVAEVIRVREARSRCYLEPSERAAAAQGIRNLLG